MDKTSTEILTAARARVERGWCKGTMACTSEGAPVPPSSQHAACYCAVGALMSAAGWDGEDEPIERPAPDAFDSALCDLCAALPDWDARPWVSRLMTSLSRRRVLAQANDSDLTAWETVLAWYDTAIEAARGRLT